jgi:hypothetical protein
MRCIMAKAVGKTTKKRAARGKSRKRKKPVNRRRRFDTATIIAAAKALKSAHTVLVAPSALTDPVGTDEVRRGLPAIDPALLPELVLLQHLAIEHFKLRRGLETYPVKEELVEFFMSVRLSHGRPLERHLAEAAATFVRPVSAMAGGRRKAVPRGKPPVSENG